MLAFVEVLANANAIFHYKMALQGIFYEHLSLFYFHFYEKMSICQKNLHFLFACGRGRGGSSNFSDGDMFSYAFDTKYLYRFATKNVHGRRATIKKKFKNILSNFFCRLTVSRKNGNIKDFSS